MNNNKTFFNQIQATTQAFRVACNTSNLPLEVLQLIVQNLSLELNMLINEQKAKEEIDSLKSQLHSFEEGEDI